jgi:hypothetical protein
MDPCLVVSHGNSAFKAEFNAFVVCTVADLAELVFPRHATDCAIWACIAHHFWAFLAGDTSDTDFQVLTFSLLEAGYASSYLCLEFVQFCC